MHDKPKMERGMVTVFIFIILSLVVPTIAFNVLGGIICLAFVMVCLILLKIVKLETWSDTGTRHWELRLRLEYDPKRDN